MTHVPPLITLDALAVGQSGTVVHITPHGRTDGGRRRPGAPADGAGLRAGRKIRMLKRGMPGGEPLAIKVGNATFALRRFEAALVSIQPE
jgi:ferrous iron transport protein A